MSLINVDKMADSQGGVLAPISSVMRNRIINGAMTIDQRNAGASVTPTNGSYALDRYIFIVTQTSKLTCQQNAGSVTLPAGFTNYLGATSSSAYSVTAGDIFSVGQRIEGFNITDLGWGSANAQTVTLSFWVRSSLTGTFGGAIRSGDGNNSYPFTYTVSSANTWEQKSVTITGPTTGGTTAYPINNTTGLTISFGLGVGSTNSGAAGAWSANSFYSATGATSVVGTNGATFYITGVQLEKGTQATSFEYRQYGQELALCQRYYETNGTLNGFWYSVRNDGIARGLLTFIVPKRAAPTVVLSEQVNATWALGSALGTSPYTVDWGRAANFSSFGLYTASAEL